MNRYFPDAWSTFPKARAPFMHELLNDMKQRRPYEGVKILHNLPITLSVLLKIECLLLSGADVTVTMPKFVKPDWEVLTILENSSVPFIAEHIFTDEYDILLDCCAELAEVTTPKIGAVEITQTGAQKYRQMQHHYPVISVDDSRLKFLEDSIGSVDGVMRALKQLIKEDLSNKKYVVFGFGKVGFGIASTLRALSNQVVVVDKLTSNLDKIQELGCIALQADDKERIHQHVQDAFCVITATGDKGFLSREYEAKYFQHKFLINVGAEDEFGEHFSQLDVFNKKMPINFLLKEPTKIEYLDPVFYAHNLGIDLLLTNNLSPTVHPLPTQMDEDILDRWFAFYQQDKQAFDNRFLALVT